MAQLDNTRHLRHLLRRAGFSMSRASIDAFTAVYTANSVGGTNHLAGYEAVVNALLDYAHVPADPQGLPVAPGETGATGFGVGLRSHQVDDRMAALGSPSLASIGDPAEASPRVDLLHPPKATIDRGVSAFAGGTSALQQWWLNRAVYSDRPLLEKMTFFWHNHLTSNDGTVGSANLMSMQNKFFRDNALGSFLHILRGITRDPAMQIYLDNDSNRVVSQPRDGRAYWEGSNENYGRELLELYGLGIDSGYTEEDVKAAARALTGWGLRDNAGQREFVFTFTEHVSSRTGNPSVTGATTSGIAGTLPFTLLGASGMWGRIVTTGTSIQALPFVPTTTYINPAADVHQQVVDWLGYTNQTGRPKAAYFMGQKLWKFFGGPLPVPNEVRDKMAAAYAGDHNPAGGIWATDNLGTYGAGPRYGIKGMLKTLFMSDSFRDDALSYRQLVKSPVEFLVGLLRQLQSVSTISANTVSTPTPISGSASSLRGMDQDILFPAFPSGWDGFDAWLNSTTWMARANYANTIVTSRTPPGSWTLASTDSSYVNMNAYCIQYSLTSWATFIDHLLDVCIDVTPTTAPGVAAGSYSWWVSRLIAYVNAVTWNGATPDSIVTVTVAGQLTSPSLKLRGILYLVFASPEYQLA